MAGCGWPTMVFEFAPDKEPIAGGRSQSSRSAILLVEDALVEPTVHRGYLKGRSHVAAFDPLISINIHYPLVI